MGAHDDTPALCDDCSNKLFEDVAEYQDTFTASAYQSGLADEAMTSRVVPNGADSGRFPKVRFT